MREILVMMDNREKDYIDSLLEEKKPERCLEWGAGGSTVYFPAKHPYIKNWTAVEHNSKWLFSIMVRMNRENTVLRFKTVDNYTDIKGEWDFILIDGLNRNKCLAKAREIISKDGVILLHDSQRSIYNKGIALYGDKKELIFKGRGEGIDSRRGITKLWV